MLIKICDVSPGDVIITSSGVERIVQDVFLSEEGCTKVQYSDDSVEWLSSRQIVVRKDKCQTFFAK